MVAERPLPTSVHDSEITVARRRRLERDQSELLDELSRTANRLDNQTSEIRSLEERLHGLPVSLPVVVDQQHRSQLKDELLQVERRLRWLDSRYPLDEERQQLSRRLDSLMHGSRRESPLWNRTAYWLDLLSAGRLSHLIPGNLDSVEGAEVSFVSRTHAEQQTFLLALRMAVVEAGNQRNSSSSAYRRTGDYMECRRGLAVYWLRAFTIRK